MISTQTKVKKPGRIQTTLDIQILPKATVKETRKN